MRKTRGYIGSKSCYSIKISCNQITKKYEKTQKNIDILYRLFYKCIKFKVLIYPILKKV